MRGVRGNQRGAGNASEERAHRYIRVYDPYSKAGSNVAVFFEGNGYGASLFTLNLLNCDNETFSKLFQKIDVYLKNNYSPPVILFSFF